MATRPIRVWNGSEWEDVAIAPFDSGEFLTTSAASATYIPDSVIDAKGDLIVGTDDNTVDKLTSGSNGQMLMADSSATAGLRYVDPPTNRNMIINGAMQVHQRGTSSTGITTGGYRTADRFNLGISQLGTWTHTVENDAPTGSGLRKSFKALCTTAKAALDAGNFVLFQQQIEGQNLQQVRKGTADAQQLTLSFWVKSNVTGTFVVELDDVDNSRRCNLAYSIAAADTWERKVLTFPSDTTGQLDNDESASLRCSFWLGAGSTFTSGTLGTTWHTNNSDRYVGGTNLAAATNNYWQITGVQLETGPVATPFEFEPYETTLRKCQRYYYRMNSAAYSLFGIGECSTTTRAFFGIPFAVTMRSAPTLSASAANTFFVGHSSGTNTAVTVVSSNALSRDTASMQIDVASGLTAGRAARLTDATGVDSGSFLAFESEL